MDAMDATDRWAKETYRRVERGEIDASRAKALFDALTPAAKEEVSMSVMVGLQELEESYSHPGDPDFEFMPPCEFRLLRFLAGLLSPGLADRVQSYSMFVTDSAWACDCDECLAFASRVEGCLRRVWR